MKISLNSILIGVSDIRKAVPFYEAVFGVKFTEVRPPFSCFTMNDIEFNVEEISPERPSGWSQKYLGTAKPIGLEVENADEFLKLVVTNGGKIISPASDKSWGWREAEFSDPDGNTFIIEQKIEN
ncbi:MAG: Glyoxalase/bleomycin resistance protein/dioxygenase [Candidatus Taylorbacteria bacterium]|nr:Glyoxalase/bleomycin resistance protein/dioxygenase [Candidatus Taylorbacteria bacterium]